MRSIRVVALAALCCCTARLAFHEPFVADPTIAFSTAPHPARPGGWLIAWGDQVDVRVITMRGGNAVTDAMVAAYLAKYSTKGTESRGV